MGSVTGSTTSAEAQKNQFMKLLLTQLQNQNPLDPQKPEEFASQLAQFSQLEQAVDTNTELESLTKQLATSSMSQLSYLGTKVDFDSKIAPVQNEEVTWTYSTVGATSVNITISDAAGKVVYTGTGETATGTHTLTINELDNVPDGTPLTMSIVAKDTNGALVTPTIYARAKIDAVNSASGTTVLEANGYSIGTDLVKRVSTSSTTSTASAS